MVPFPSLRRPALPPLLCPASFSLIIREAVAPCYYLGFAFGTIFGHRRLFCSDIPRITVVTVRTHSDHWTRIPYHLCTSRSSRPRAVVTSQPPPLRTDYICSFLVASEKNTIDSNIIVFLCRYRLDPRTHLPHSPLLFFSRLLECTIR